MHTVINGTESEVLAVIRGQHGKSADGLSQKVSFQTAFEGVNITGFTASAMERLKPCIDKNAVN